jgi:hypothetical protein
LVLASALALGGLAAASAATTVSPVFQPLLPDLLRTHVPLYLPTIFPGAVKSRLHVSMGTDQLGSYEVNVSTVANCDGADACQWGWAAGQKAQAAAAMAGETPVPLGKHITGEYSAGRCGASCAGASLTWAVGRFSYSVGGYLNRSQVVAMARSAVAAGAYTGH